MTRNQLEYQGKITQYQQEGSNFKGKKYQKIVYTERQEYLYNRLVYGLESLSEEELLALKPSKRTRIEFFHKKAQMLINRMKQERIVALSDHVFNTFFPKSPLAKSLVLNYRESPKILCKMKLSHLRISKPDIINAFINEKLLPKNFYNKQNLIPCK